MRDWRRRRFAHRMKPEFHYKLDHSVRACVHACTHIHSTINKDSRPPSVRCVSVRAVKRPPAPKIHPYNLRIEFRSANLCTHTHTDTGDAVLLYVIPHMHAHTAHKTIQPTHPSPRASHTNMAPTTALTTYMPFIIRDRHFIRAKQWRAVPHH